MDELNVWVDLETTGLDAYKSSPGGIAKYDVPLELGIVLTDEEDRFVASRKWLIWDDADPTWHFARDRAMQHEIVGPMHKMSGLWDDLAKGEISLPRTATMEAIKFLEGYEIRPGKAPVHGSSVRLDRTFMDIYLHELDQFFHYRIIDVSTVKELCRRHNPRVYERHEEVYSAPDKAHRVIDDCMDSIAELNFYKENFLFVTHPELDINFEEPTPKVIHDMLKLVEGEFPAHMPSVKTIESWLPETRESVGYWAAAVHLVASDNQVFIPPLPHVLRRKES